MKHWKRKAFSVLCQVVVVDAACADVLLLAPRIQGYDSDSVVHALEIDGRYFLDVQDMANSLRFEFDADSGRGRFLGRDFDVPASGRVTRGGLDFYPADFYERLLNLRLGVNSLEMQLDVDSDDVLPTTISAHNAARRSDMLFVPRADPFDNYSFDERMFTFPVVDFIYRRDQNFRRLNRHGRSSYHGNFYQANMAMLFAGLDTQVTLFGDDYGRNRLSRPGARVTVGRTMLDQPPNAFRLARFQAGDIVSTGNNLFYNGVSGRGVVLSSFKDLVVSSDKTIDITGPIPAGWDAELYLNNQLIGFRQSGIAGRYEFKNIPVSYGLNDFKVVLYGPYGEVREEQRRFYSGTSPVRAGEIGYDISAQQMGKFVINDNYAATPESDKVIANSMFYYGATDYLTLIGGFARTENPWVLRDVYGYSTLGAQLSLNGVSVQYNANYNMDRSALGHHIDAQGDVYIGTLFARYEHYGDTRTPSSYFLNTYLKDLFEGRLTGSLPWINVPYYVAYTYRESDVGNTYREIHARISPNFMRYYNVTLENMYRDNAGAAENYISAIAQATYRRMRANAQVRYRTYPSSSLHDYGAFAEYRWDKNTFAQVAWNHDCRSNYADAADMDSIGVGVGRLFKFGGITFNVSADTDRNLAFGVTYNISFGKLPDSNAFFANAENQMMNYGTIYARATDETGAPVPGVDIIASGREAPTKTAADGGALVTNLEPYQKVVVAVDETNVYDISLVPEWVSKKIVLRPGVIRPLDIVLRRLGGFEGQLANPVSASGVRVRVRDAGGDVIASKKPDIDGAFIFDGLAYGEYVVEIVNADGVTLDARDVTINSSFQTLEHPFAAGK